MPRMAGVQQSGRYETYDSHRYPRVERVSSRSRVAETEDDEESGDEENGMEVNAEPRRAAAGAMQEEEEASDIELEVMPEEEEESSGDDEDLAVGVESEDEPDDNESPEEEEPDDVKEEYRKEPTPVDVPEPVTHRVLRVKLKLPSAPVPATSPKKAAPWTSPRVRRTTRVNVIESESEESAPESEEVDEEVVGKGKGKLTARQAVLASVSGSTHVTLADSAPSSRKKKLNEEEIALRREETARKRKSVVEKKLQDEKAETINRLLKKQSRPRNGKVKAVMALPTPTSLLPTAAATPTATSTRSGSTPAGDDDDAEEEVQEEIPVMYRWTSTKAGEKFSVPVDALVAEPVFTFAEKETMGADVEMKPIEVIKPVQAVCSFSGCGSPRKYRLVRDWNHGACGMEHLKLL